MSGFISDALGTIFSLAFEISPIVLTNGIAQNLPSNALPIVVLTERANFPLGLLSGSVSLASLDSFFAHFIPMPGSTLGDNQIGNYPFANQTVAANAIIAQPLTVSMLMICPVQNNYLAGLGTMLSLQSALAQHDASGGTYTIVTPKMFYTNCIRTRMVDVSTAASHQAQNTYQLDFVQPLLTLEAAQAAQSALMNQLSNGQQVNGQPTWSGLFTAGGFPASLTGPSLFSSANNVAGSVATPV